MAMVLEGIRVVELARYISGPYCGMLLADLGADVVKVETPGGDPTRFEGPWIGEESLLLRPMNRNKRGVVIDSAVRGRARRADGAAAGSGHPDRELPARGDRHDGLRARGAGGAEPALHHGQRVRFRAGVRPARPHRLRLHPAVPDGPRRDQRTPGRLPDAHRRLHRRHGRRPDRDHRRAGRAAAARADGRRPAGRRSDARQRADAARGDSRRRRDRRGARAGRQRRSHVGAGNAYRASDGWVYIHAGPDTFFQRIARAMGRDEIIELDRFKDIVSRVANRAEVDAIVGGRVRRGRSRRWRRSWPRRAFRRRASTRSCRRSTTPSCRSATGWSRWSGQRRDHSGAGVARVSQRSPTVMRTACRAADDRSSHRGRHRRHARHRPRLRRAAHGRRVLGGVRGT